jgi:DNA-binding transcriptional LysR family regulator
LSRFLKWSGMKLAQANEEIQGEIAIGCNESQSMSSLAEWIVIFRQMHPLITFDVRSGNNFDVKEWLDRGIVDVGLLGEPVEVTKYSYIRLPEKDEWEPFYPSRIRL